MRLCALPVAALAAVAAFALFGANAGVAAAADTAHPAPNTQVFSGTTGGTNEFSIHLPGNSTGGLGSTCNTNSTQDPLTGSQVILDADLLCGHVVFRTSGPANITATVTYPSAGGFNIVDLVLCTVGGPPDEFCASGPHVVCDPVAQSAPDANDMVTATLVCSNVPAGTYELLVDPFFFVACDFDMCGSTTPCAATLPTGACVSGSFTVSPTSVVSETGGGGSGSPDSADKMTGGGHVDRYQDDQFALEVWEGMTNPKGQVRFATKGNTCVLRSTQLSYAVVSRTATGGHAEFDGWAEVRTKSGGRTQGHFHGYADDNGEGSSKGDRFRLTEAPDGCLNTDDVVTRGNVQAHAVA